MTIKTEQSLSNFEFWAGAKTNAGKLSEEELDRIEAELEEFYPDGMDETELNDLFWFDFGWVCSIVGLTYNVETAEIER